MRDTIASPQLIGLGLGFVLSACSAPPEPVGVALDCALSPSQIGQFITVPPGQFIKGAAPLYPEEAPSLRLQVDAFAIQIHEVTLGQFEEFVDATGYVTEAEQGVIEARIGAGSAVFQHPTEQAQSASAWRLESSANWRQPYGENGAPKDWSNYPVVHITKADAEAYARWAGGRLPNEVEWEYAAHLGLPDPNDPTSSAYGEDGPRANTWQGVFPVVDLGQDGYQGVAPIGCFEPNQLGLYDMIGNVWEWTDTPFAEGTHTLKGGSFLCADNFCRRYRPAARHPQETDFSSNHIGFRLVRDPLPD